MRLVVWNCAMGWARDLVRLRSLNCDVGVLSEVPADPGDGVNSGDWLWAGDSTRGLALAGLGVAVERVEPNGEPGVLSVAGEADGGLRVLGIWANPPAGETYSSQAVRSIEAHAEWLTNGAGIIAGDFNVSGSGTEVAGLTQITELAESLGYVSLYHELSSEPMGGESTMTYFHQRKEHWGFHIDYCFVHRDRVLPAIDHFEIGTYLDWVAARGGSTGLSDHVPLVIDIDPSRLDSTVHRSSEADGWFSSSELDQYLWIAERDVDLVLSIALKAHPAVGSLVRIAVDTTADRVAGVRHSSGTGGAGETDIEVMFDDNVMVLIENKLTSPFQPDQPRRYRDRAAHVVATDVDVMACHTLLLAPEAYLRGASRKDLAFFDGALSYEEVRDVFIATGEPALRELALVVEHAIRKHRRNGSTDDAVSARYHELFRLGHERHGFPLPTGYQSRRYGAASPWLWISNGELPSDEQTAVSLRAELDPGSATLLVRNDDIDKAQQIEHLRSAGEEVRLAGKSVAVTRRSPAGAVNPDMDLEQQQLAVDALLSTAAELAAWWSTTGIERLRACTEDSPDQPES